MQFNSTFVFIRTHFTRTLRLRLPKNDQARCKDPKKLQEWEIDQINWNLIHKWAMNEQNAQAQKKLYNKIRSMPSKSSAAT